MLRPRVEFNNINQFIPRKKQFGDLEFGYLSQHLDATCCVPTTILLIKATFS